MDITSTTHGFGTTRVTNGYTFWVVRMEKSLLIVTMIRNGESLESKTRQIQIHAGIFRHTALREMTSEEELFTGFNPDKTWNVRSASLLGNDLGRTRFF